MAKIRYTKEMLEIVVKDSDTFAQVARSLGYAPRSGSQAYLAKRIRAYGISTEHFVGQAWNKGHTFSIRPISDYLENKVRIRSQDLKKRLIKEGLAKDECVLCGIGTEWSGRELVLQIDHINGDSLDNSFSNIRILCPNCHSQTETFCSRNKTPGRREEKQKLKALMKVKESIRKRQPRPESRKVERPSKEELERLIQEIPMVEIGRRFGVSDNAVRKWCKWSGIEIRRKVS